MKIIKIKIKRVLVNGSLCAFNRKLFVCTVMNHFYFTEYVE